MPEIDTFKQRDIDYYDRTYGINPYPIEVIKVNGGADPAQQVSETTLDIQVIHAIAPRAKILVYESPADFGSLANNFNKIVSDNRAKVISVSLGGCEPAIWEAPDLGRNYFATLNNIFRQAAAQGMSVFVASGDDGAYTCHRNDPNDNELSASLPATNPFVTAVGGTALLVNDNGSYYSEAGWEGPLAGSGSGGGLSVGYLRPDWQSGPGVSNQYSDRRAPGARHRGLGGPADRLPHLRLDRWLLHRRGLLGGDRRDERLDAAVGLADHAGKPARDEQLVSRRSASSIPCSTRWAPTQRSAPHSKT